MAGVAQTMTMINSMQLHGAEYKMREEFAVQASSPLKDGVAPEQREAILADVLAPQQFSFESQGDPWNQCSSEENWIDDDFQTEGLSEKKLALYYRMFDIILKSTHGPHPLREDEFQPNPNRKVVPNKPPSRGKMDHLAPFHPTSFATQQSLQPTPSQSVSTNLHNSFLKFLARRILSKKVTIYNRSTIIHQIDHQVIYRSWSDDSWSDAKVRQDTMEDLGIKVHHVSLSWAQQMQHESRRMEDCLCYRPSKLRWSWTMVD